jgi:hypothetical protein
MKAGTDFGLGATEEQSAFVQLEFFEPGNMTGTPARATMFPDAQFFHASVLLHCPAMALQRCCCVRGRREAYDVATNSKKWAHPLSGSVEK